MELKNQNVLTQLVVLVCRELELERSQDEKHKELKKKR